MERLHVSVRAESCIGTGNCHRIAPEVFSLTGDGPAEVIDPHPAEARREQVEEAEALCPTDSIEVLSR